MKRLLKYTALTVLAFILLFAALVKLSATFRNQLTDWIFISRDQTTHPISRQEASRYFQPDYFPKNAHDIQYASVYGRVTPVFEVFLRFEAPLEDCLSFVKNKYPKIVIKPITASDQQHGTFGENRDWFDTHLIKHGFEGSSEVSLEKIWIDTDRGIVYYFDTD